VNATTSGVMQSVTQALAQANALTGGLAGVQRMVVGYERQKALLEMTHESMGTLEDEEDDQEVADEMLAQIAAEASLALKFDLPVTAAAASHEDEADLEELMKRFHRLVDDGDPRGGKKGDPGGGSAFPCVS